MGQAARDRGWSYSTVLADVAEPVALEPRTWEHTRTRWATRDEMTHLALHPGLARLMRRLEAADESPLYDRQRAHS